MTAYALALFVHIAGALGMAAAIGLEWLGLQQLRTATMPLKAGAGLQLLGGTRRLGFPSMLAAVLTGLYMMLTTWGGQPWLYTTLGAIVLLIALTGANGPRMAAIGRALARESAPLSETFHRVVSHPLLVISLYTRTALILGIVFLKVTRPDWTGSLLTTGLAIAIGIASAFSLTRRAQAQPQPLS